MPAGGQTTRLPDRRNDCFSISVEASYGFPASRPGSHVQARVRAQTRVKGKHCLLQVTEGSAHLLCELHVYACRWVDRRAGF